MNIQQVQQIVQALFRPSSQEEKTQANIQLQHLLNDPQSLNFVVPLMSIPKNDPMYQFKMNIGATILQKRLLFNISLFNQQTIEQMKQFVVKNLLENSNNNFIIKQLSICLNLIYLHDQLSNSVVLTDYIFKMIPLNKDTVLLLTTVFNEIALSLKNINLIEITYREKCLGRIAESTPIVIQFLMQATQTFTDKKCVKEFVECCGNWIKETNLSFQQYIQINCIPFILQQLSPETEDSVSTALEFFIGKMISMNPNIKGQEKEVFAQVVVQMIQHLGQYITQTKQSISCFFKLTELIGMDFSSYLNSQYKQTIDMYLNLIISMCQTNSEEMIQSISDSLFHIFILPGSSRSRNSAYLYQYLQPYAKQYFEIVTKYHFAIGNRQGEEIVDFLKFRKGCLFETLKLCVDIINSQVAVDILHNFWGQNIDKEQILTALIATHEDLANVQSPKILQILNNAVQIIQQQGNKTPLLFLRATIKVVGKYNTYLSETNAEVVFNYLQFLTAFIDVPQCIKYVSKALYLLTSETIRFMKTNPTPLQQIYQKTIQSVMAGKLQGNEKIYERFVESFCMVIESVNTHEYLKQLLQEPTQIIQQSIQQKQLNNLTLVAFWILETIFKSIHRSKYCKEICAVIIDIQLPQMLFSILQVSCQSKAMKIIEQVCNVLSQMFLVIGSHSQPFFDQTLQILTNCYIQTNHEMIIDCLAHILESIRNKSLFSEKIHKLCLPLLVKSFQSCTNQSNMLIIYICNCLFNLLKIKLDQQFKQMIVQWNLSMLGTVIDDEAYHSLANILIDLMNDPSVNIFSKQPTAILILIQSCTTYYSAKREDSCILLLRECYTFDPQQFCQNILIVFNEKYPQTPVGMKQNFLQNKKLSKSEFGELFKDFFKMFKE